MMVSVNFHFRQVLIPAISYAKKRLPEPGGNPVMYGMFPA